MNDLFLVQNGVGFSYNEREAVNIQISDTRNQSLMDRQAARAEFTQAVKMDFALIQLVVKRILAGDYGEGAAQLAAVIVHASKRTNKVAQLGQLAAALEWNCPPEWAAQAWKSCTHEERQRVNRLIQEVIDNHLSD